MRMLILLLLTLLSVEASYGWDFEKHNIPLDQILSGGPPKDGIPALSEPRLLPAAEARYLRGEDTVLGFVWGGEARAYPVRILAWHELVNDTVGGTPVLASW